jgi:hypothetical protein
MAGKVDADNNCTTGLRLQLGRGLGDLIFGCGFSEPDGAEKLFFSLCSTPESDRLRT